MKLSGVSVGENVHKHGKNIDALGRFRLLYRFFLLYLSMTLNGRHRQGAGWMRTAATKAWSQ